MLAIGVMTTIAYFVLGLDNALLLGVIAGLTETIPIIGPAIGVVPALIVAFVEGGPEVVLLVGIVYIVIQVLEGNVLVPLVMKNAVGLPPFIVVVSLLVGVAVAGLLERCWPCLWSSGPGRHRERAQAREKAVALQAHQAERPSRTPPTTRLGRNRWSLVAP